jgi:hypothetical protein
VSAPVPRPAAAGSVDQAGERAVRRFVTVLAVTVGGLCFLFSLGNVYQLAVDLRLWGWIRPLVAPAVDLSLVALVVGIRFLARRGLSGAELRRPRLFMLAVGLAAWALNTAGAVAERDWGRAAFDSLAPGLLLGWAEVLPWFLRQFHASTHPTAPAEPSVPVPGGGPPAGNGALVPAMAASPGPAGVPAAALGGPPPASGGNGTGSGGNGTTSGSGRGARLPRGTDPAAGPVPPAPGLGNGGRNDNGGAAMDAGMRAWWAAERAAGRTPSGAELDRVCGRDPNNGTGRKARARFLREEAAGRFHAPATPPPGLPQAPQGPVPVPTVAAAPAADAPAPDPYPGPAPAAPAEPERRGPDPAPAGTGNPPRAAGPPTAPDPAGPPRR